MVEQPMSAEKTQATVRPWSTNGATIVANKDHYSGVITAAWIANVCEIEAPLNGSREANAELICRTVNSHEAMYEALEAIYAGVSDYQREIAPLQDNLKVATVPILYVNIVKIQELLKSARGES